MSTTILSKEFIQDQRKYQLISSSHQFSVFLVKGLANTVREVLTRGGMKLPALVSTTVLPWKVLPYTPSSLI